jgi:hypothetical protein
MKWYQLIQLTLFVATLFFVGGQVFAQDATPPQMPPQGRSETEAASVQALMGTAFTYQGNLKQGGVAISASCDFEFNLFDAFAGGMQIGTTQTKESVAVSSGLFTVADLDFGNGAFNGQARWLAIGVRCPAGSGSYTDLAPRQAMTPAPYALALPGFYTTVSSISPDSTPNLIGGHISNTVTSGVTGATISGGGGPNPDDGENQQNRVSDHGGTVSGGAGNVAGNLNGIINDSSTATVGGGYKNLAKGQSSTISGGAWSIAEGAYATIGGGNDNSASGQFTTVGGGTLNSASGERATVGGGTSNSASGLNAVTPGGQLNWAGGDYSFAAGRRARANHAGAFVWAGSIDADVASPTTETFSVRALGGIWLGTTNTPAIPQGRFLNTSTGAYLSLTGIWTNSSDRNAKENFTRVDPQSILAQVAALPITTWNYRGETTSARHIGPMAQDFYAAFGLGADDISIGTVDADGIALASIQGLYQLTQAQAAEIAAEKAKAVSQAAEIAVLANRLAVLEGQTDKGTALPFALPGWLGLALGLGALAVGLVWNGRQTGRR